MGSTSATETENIFHPPSNPAVGFLSSFEIVVFEKAMKNYRIHGKRK